MAKKKDVCKKCKWWKEAIDMDPADPRLLGDCYHDPPVLCQTLIPAVIRATGFQHLRWKQEKFQMRPVTEWSDICSKFQRKVKK